MGDHHGEPKANNILIISKVPVMIDWDTVRPAPPSRDLWMTGGHQRYTELIRLRLPPEELASTGCARRRLLSRPSRREPFGSTSVAPVADLEEPRAVSLG
jgi:hypothetical protein